MLGYTACWAEEAFRVTALTGSGTGFQQQGSSIDVIFSSYFWLYKMGCRGYQMFEELNGLLVGISQSPQGKGKTAKVLEEMGTPVSRSLVLMMSKSTEVHLPPFILNSSRLYDLVAIFGTFPVDDDYAEVLMSAYFLYQLEVSLVLNPELKKLSYDEQKRVVEGFARAAMQSSYSSEEQGVRQMVKHHLVIVSPRGLFLTGTRVGIGHQRRCHCVLPVLKPPFLGSVASTGGQ
ncbi:hypothetical protein IscW_ISCW017950 [Ixodes scapularis]|uniref:Uncharacterized protein n=1 Tax=Ixodes scapularis TaxID=6945 RepID=B7PK93_IXOSC|nr:hypothetical protein IscW_ISCW017950 [Ixodes scapularis]|eukprot:XP_002409768.1 hypothetical protein IscW_ISCW017950 [Ixodes scapularis]